MPLQHPPLSSLVVQFIEQYLRLPEGHAVGQPMRLMDWQREFLVAVFDNPHGTRRAILSVGRKASKSTLVAALLLAYVVGPLARQNSQVYSAALSREQASVVFALMAKMVRMNPELAEHISIRDSAREMLCTLTGVRFRALSADANTAMGLSPIAFCLDEAGQVGGPQFPLFDALHTAQGAHGADAIEFIISTQAASDGDFLSLMIDDALRGDDPRTVCHLYTAPPDCGLMDESAWRAANPAIGTIVSLDYVRNLAQEAVRLPSREPQFRNLILNMRCEVRAPFVPPALWARSGADPAPYEGEPVFCGLDLSAGVDLTALVAVWQREGVWQVRPFVWTPAQGLAERSRRDRAPYDVWVREGYMLTTPGASIDYDFVAQQLIELAADWNVEAVAFDRWRIQTFKQSLARLGADSFFTDRMVPFGQGFRDFSPALDILEAELLNERLAHGGHPVLSSCVLNATVQRDPAGNRKLDRVKSTARIDGAVALAMALACARQREPAHAEHDGTLFCV